MLFALASAGDATTARPLIGVGYYVDFDPNSWTTVRTEGHRFNWIVTTNFAFTDASGRLSGAHDGRIMHLARSRGIKVHFRVANLVRGAYDGAVIHTVLARPNTRLAAVASIVDALRTYTYDGVSLDLQNVAPADREAFTAFVKDLAGQLHAQGRTLSVTVPAAAGDSRTSAYDLAALAQAADWIVVLAYREHDRAGPAGPVASLPWVERTIDAVTRAVPASKVLLAVAFVGYDWPQEGSGAVMSMREAMIRARRTGAEIQWDAVAQAPYFQAFGRTVYFEDTRSIDLKLSLAARRGLAGVAFWRLGYEVSEVWTTASAYLKPPQAQSARR